MNECKVIAIANEKGGVGKTTTAVQLGIGLVRDGYKVLLIDADPQGSLTISLGITNPDEIDISLATLMHFAMEAAMRTTTHSTSKQALGAGTALKTTSALTALKSTRTI